MLSRNECIPYHAWFPSMLSHRFLEGRKILMCRLRWRCSRYEHASYQFRRHKPQAVYISCSSCKFCSKRQRIAEATAALVRGPPLLTKNDPVMRCAFDANSILASKSAALVWMSKSKRKKTPAALPFFPSVRKRRRKRGRVIRRGRFVRLSNTA